MQRPMSDVAVSQTVKSLNCTKSLSEGLITTNLHAIRSRTNVQAPSKSAYDIAQALRRCSPVKLTK